MDRLTYIDIPKSPWSSQISLAWPYSEVRCAVSTCKVNRSCVFLKRLWITCWLWPVRFYYMQILFMGYAARCWVHVNSSCSAEELKDNIWREIVNISKKALSCVGGNILGRCKRCLETGSLHFEALIQSKAGWTEGAKWTPKFPADAGFVCGKVPMTASMHDGHTLCSIKLWKRMHFAWWPNKRETWSQEGRT